MNLNKPPIAGIIMGLGALMMLMTTAFWAPFIGATYITSTTPLGVFAKMAGVYGLFCGLAAAIYFSLTQAWKCDNR